MAKWRTDGGSRTKENGGGDIDPAAPQRDSAAAPSSTPGKTTLVIHFTPEELRRLEAEVGHLRQFSIICRIIGSRPSRGELRDLIYGRLQLEAETIKSIQFLGKGFYHIEFMQASTVQMILGMNPLDLRGAKAFFSPWQHGFNAEEAAKKGDKIFKITTIFPNLSPEYRSLLFNIGSQLGIPMESEEEVVSRTARANGMPSVRLLVSGTTTLPELIQLPTTGGGTIDQRIEYAGLPNQCFECRQLGHIAKQCPLSRSKEAVDASVSSEGNSRQQEQWQPIRCFTCNQPG